MTTTTHQPRHALDPRPRRSPYEAKLRGELVHASELPAVPCKITFEQIHSARSIKKQLEILNLLAHGVGDDAEIARQLGLTVVEVKEHIVAVMLRLHAATRIEAVFLACVYGLICLNPELPSVLIEYA